ncbi:OmpA family protein [Buttiauxella noackiae]|uniref:OmpA family protein n=1 Tax=Buttiauxella noackiae TaxID=82992 RepID=UPI0023559054|nr:OmpA family protein [Buttiauxella noackiae]MCA1924574.1 outer membrane protein assembly factor BamE [Buttiauxella noackiae]
MNLQFKPVRTAAVLAAMLLLAACSRSVSDVDSQGKTTSPVFPDASGAVRSEGSFVNQDNLSNIREGMTKAQIYALLGVPHFNEGVIKVKEWDYIFKFTKADNSVLTCQYKVLFDSQMKAQSFYFLPENCLDQLKTKPSVKAAVHHDLSTEGLFTFGSATLLPDGVRQIQALSASLKADGGADKHIVITGHTDRFGSKTANNALSLARADSVRQILVDSGISGSIIETHGRGDSEPRTYCPGPKSPKVIACLAPNRRISVDVIYQSGK